MDFYGFVDDIIMNKWDVYGVEVYVNSVLKYSYGNTKNCIYKIYSATKSVLSIVFGIAYDRGLVDLNASILDYLPKDKEVALSEEKKESFSKLTMHRLLTMSVEGFPFRPEGEKWLDYCLAGEISHPEEVVFCYNNICAFLVGVALTEVLKRDIGEFIKEEIFRPLNILDYEFKYSPDGYFYGASGMKLSVHDLSKIGLLMNNGGVYLGKRIVSEDYISMATSVQQINSQGGYGYLFWKYRDGFSINGKYEQKCYCLPKSQIVVTYLSHIENESLDLLNSMEKNILGK